jgi:hypothetical protein
MSNFYSRFFKVFTLLMGLCANANCATLLDYGFKRRPARVPVAAAPAGIDSYDWGTNPHTGNIVISDTSGKTVGTIFPLKYEYQGLYGVFLNTSDRKTIKELGFTDSTSAKEWVVMQAMKNKISLAIS